MWKVIRWPVFAVKLVAVWLVLYCALVGARALDCGSGEERHAVAIAGAMFLFIVLDVVQVVEAKKRTAAVRSFMKHAVEVGAVSEEALAKAGEVLVPRKAVQASLLTTALGLVAVVCWFWLF
jgi:hypothetical protein